MVSCYFVISVLCLLSFYPSVSVFSSVFFWYEVFRFLCFSLFVLLNSLFSCISFVFVFLSLYVFLTCCLSCYFARFSFIPSVFLDLSYLLLSLCLSFYRFVIVFCFSVPVSVIFVLVSQSLFLTPSLSLQFYLSLFVFFYLRPLSFCSSASNFLCLYRVFFSFLPLYLLAFVSHWPFCPFLSLYFYVSCIPLSLCFPASFCAGPTV